MQLATSALHATAETLAGLLGPWQTADPADDGTVHLHGPFERHIGMRLLHGGSTIQLWATGGVTPADTPTADDTATPLPTGHRWHTTCHIGSLAEDQDPAVELFTTIHDNLLPVFDAKPAHVGHRPWQHQDASDVDQADMEAAAGVDLDDQPDPEAPTAEPQADPQPEPEPAAEPTPKAPAKRTPKKPRTTATPAAATQPKPRPARKRVPKASSA